MDRPDPDKAETLLQASESVEKLLKGSIVSVGILFVSLGLLVATALVSFGRLDPLERQVAARQLELEDLERTAQELAVEKTELGGAIVDARARLSSIQREVESLAQASPPTSARRAAAVARSIEEVDREVATKVQGSSSNPAPGAASSAINDAIQRLFADDAATRIRAYEWLMARSNQDTTIVPRLLSYARDNPENRNGVYNALVVLNGLESSTLEANATAIADLTAGARLQGPRTADVAASVELRLRRQ
ncbi:MAG: hypothetical protein GEU90_18840 [Gemmatimonas sp.]|nr:hypothetical protein [Gemmatimonas sp.]